MKKIELEISDDLYDKYKENKQFCDRKFVKSIKYAYKESELKKLLESDRKTQHGLFTKLNTNLATIIMHLSVLAEYVASQRPSMIKSLNIQSIDQNKFLIFVQSIWLHTLCLINQIREMLQISNSSTNCQDIIFNNPFIIWDKDLLQARHYKHKVVNLTTEANKIYANINNDVVHSLADYRISPWDHGKIIKNAVNKYKNELEQNEIDIYSQLYCVNHDNAEKIFSYRWQNKVEFVLPVILNDTDQHIQDLHDRIINIRNFFTLLLSRTCESKNIDEVLTHRNELWKWLMYDCVKMPVISTLKGETKK